jgi:hypothetical protein
MKRLIYRVMAVAAMLLAVGCNGGDDPKDNPSQEIKVDILKFTATDKTVEATFAPSAAVASYTVAIGQEEDLADFEAGTLESIHTFDNNSAADYTFTNLEPATSYTVFARGVGKDGTVGKTSTLAVLTIEEQFDLTIAITEETVVEEYAKFTFTPGVDVAKYSVALGKASDQAAFEAGTLAGIVNYNAGTKQTQGFDKLTPNTEYTLFAQAQNQAGKKGEVVTYAITTQKDEYKLEFKVNDINALVTNFTINMPATVTKYMYYFTLQDYWNADASYETKVADIEEGGYEDSESFTDNLTLLGTLNEGFWFVAVSYDANGGKHVNEFSFTTPSFNSSLPTPSPLTVTVGELTSTTASFNITMGANTLGFAFWIYDQSQYDTLFNSGGLAAVTQDLLNSATYYGYISTQNYTSAEYSWSGFKAGQSYVHCAIPLNGNGVQGTGDIDVLPFVSPGGTSAASAGASAPRFNVPSYRNVTGLRLRK